MGTNSQVIVTFSPCLKNSGSVVTYTVGSSTINLQFKPIDRFRLIYGLVGLWLKREDKIHSQGICPDLKWLLVHLSWQSKIIEDNNPDRYHHISTIALDIPTKRRAEETYVSKSSSITMQKCSVASITMSTINSSWTTPSSER